MEPSQLQIKPNLRTTTLAAAAVCVCVCVCSTWNSCRRTSAKALQSPRGPRGRPTPPRTSRWRWPGTSVWDEGKQNTHTHTCQEKHTHTHTNTHTNTWGAGRCRGECVCLTRDSKGFGFETRCRVQSNFLRHF